MAQGRTISVTRRPMDLGESVDEAENSGGMRWTPIERWRMGRLDHANVEIIRVARGLLTRIVDLLK